MYHPPVLERFGTFRSLTQNKSVGIDDLATVKNNQMCNPDSTPTSASGCPALS